MSPDDKITNLRRQISMREAELASLKSELDLALAEESSQQQQPHQQPHQSPHEQEEESWKWPLSQQEYDRYSRQMIVPNFGQQSQIKLKQARVLIVGAGGLGCPAAAYLAGAGVGSLGLVDGDVVELSNLHRQIAHSSHRVGMNKVDSAITYLKQLNPTITYQAYKTHLTPQNAHSIVSNYDFVLDCTDHPTSRYLISDICVLLHKPLISASAFQTAGQLIALNLNPPTIIITTENKTSPCYRCIFPRPPPPDAVIGCGEGGILGPVVGVMGVLQALETIKVITTGIGSGGMLLFGADSGFRSVRMRGRRRECFACGDEPGLSKQILESSMDYVQFCGVREPVRVLASEERVSVEEYRDVIRSGKTVTLLDVREKEHFDLCHVEGALNVPINRFMNHGRGGSDGGELPSWLPTISPSSSIYVICRVGNDSQIAVQKLKEMDLMNKFGVNCIKDIKGGIKAWKTNIDPSMPVV